MISSFIMLFEVGLIALLLLLVFRMLTRPGTIRSCRRPW